MDLKRRCTWPRGPWSFWLPVLQDGHTGQPLLLQKTEGRYQKRHRTWPHGPKKTLYLTPWSFDPVVLGLSDSRSFRADTRVSPYSHKTPGGRYQKRHCTWPRGLSWSSSSQPHILSWITYYKSYIINHVAWTPTLSGSHRYYYKSYIINHIAWTPTLSGSHRYYHKSYKLVIYSISVITYTNFVKNQTNID